MVFIYPEEGDGGFFFGGGHMVFRGTKGGSVVVNRV